MCFLNSEKTKQNIMNVRQIKDGMIAGYRFELVNCDTCGQTTAVKEKKREEKRKCEHCSNQQHLEQLYSDIMSPGQVTLITLNELKTQNWKSANLLIYLVFFRLLRRKDELKKLSALVDDELEKWIVINQKAEWRYHYLLSKVVNPAQE
jgi:hypothetical protein